MSHHSNSTDSGWVTTFVFVGGFLIGAIAAILMTPESGPALRQRLARGARTAQEELSEIAEETKDKMVSLAREAQVTMKHTASRLGSALDATREALKSKTDTPSEMGGNF